MRVGRGVSRHVGGIARMRVVLPSIVPSNLLDANRQPYSS